MKFKTDHDYHIHSMLSSCSGDENQTAENILKYAKDNGLKEICITDHFWDENVEGASDWYKPQNFEHISEILPLPTDEDVDFYFGCETEMDRYMTVGLSDKMVNRFDFIIVPTTHLHMGGFTIAPEDYSLPRRAEVYVKRFDKLLSLDLPFKKVGIAHLSCPLMCMDSKDAHIKLLDLIDDKTFKELFERSARHGLGIELNMPIERYSETELQRVMRPYKIAKETGCKFYMGSDSHHPNGFIGAVERFEKMADYLGLTEEDRFRPFSK